MGKASLCLVFLCALALTQAARMSRHQGNGMQKTYYSSSSRAILRQSAGDAQVQIFLKTRSNEMQIPEDMLSADKQKELANWLVNNGQFSLNAPTKVICQGYRTTANDKPEEQLVNAYIRKYDDINVLVVRWQTWGGSSKPTKEQYELRDGADGFTDDLLKSLYWTPAMRIKEVGEKTALVLQAIQERKNYRQDIHLIGEGPGAHAMGWAGYTLQNEVDRFRPIRLTALDPAGPCFEKTNTLCINGGYRQMRKLEKDDAELVDVIHTDFADFGYKGLLGDVDFYVNGGRQAKGEEEAWKSHRYAAELMVDSIRDPEGSKFQTSRKCTSVNTAVSQSCPAMGSPVIMGEGCELRTSGIYLWKDTDRS